MAEYIDKDAIYKAFANACTDVLERASEIDYIAGFSDELVIEILDDIPVADVAPVKHGRWEKRRNSWYCTNCGKGYIITYGMLAASAYNYCPNCGAKMKGDTENAFD